MALVQRGLVLEAFNFTPHFPTYIDLELTRNPPESLGRNAEGEYVIRQNRGWMLEEGVTEDVNVPRENPAEQRWVNRWVDWHLVRTQHVLATRRLNFLQAHLASPAWHPFLSTEECQELLQKPEQAKHIILRLSSTYSGVLTASYRPLPFCQYCNTTPSDFWYTSTCGHLFCPQCGPLVGCSRCGQGNLYLNFQQENVEIDASGHLRLQDNLLAFVLRRRLFYTPGDLKYARA